MNDPRSEHRQHLITEIKKMMHLEASKVAGLRAELDVSLVEEISTLIQATRENVVAGLAALESEVKRARVSADVSSTAIVRWTKVLAAATVVLAGATIALVWATLQLTH